MGSTRARARGKDRRGRKASDKAKAKEKAKAKKRAKLTAKTADKHRLYQDSVQAPEFEVGFAAKHFKRRVGRKARSLREDFCGTALLCAHWVKSHRDRTATGVDIDPEVLAWGREHNVAPLGDAAERVTLIEGDVRETREGRHDVVMALNYSYFCFKSREALRGYFRSVKSHLVDDGLFFLDLFGGWESVQVLEEPRKQDGYRYVWHQAKYNPVTADFLGHIHFEFKDGSRLAKAFTYDWRLWTLPELGELLHEAGFAHVEVLWEQEDEAGEGTGVFKPRLKVDNDPGYNAYLLASVDTPPKLAARKRPPKVLPRRP
jgi:SAM-dependent methyltransferase